MADAYIYDAVRTPRGKGKKDGSLHEITALSLASQVLEALRKNAGLVECDLRGTDLSGVNFDGVNLRNAKLAESDWTQVADTPVDKTVWATYRQALRDIPQDFATPEEVVWPTLPV